MAVKVDFVVHGNLSECLTRRSESLEYGNHFLPAPEIQFGHRSLSFAEHDRCNMIVETVFVALRVGERSQRLAKYSGGNMNIAFCAFAIAAQFKLIPGT